MNTENTENTENTDLEAAIIDALNSTRDGEFESDPTDPERTSVSLISSGGHVWGKNLRWGSSVRGPREYTARLNVSRDGTSGPYVFSLYDGNGPCAARIARQDARYRRGLEKALLLLKKLSD